MFRGVWECSWVRLPDDDLNTEKFILTPYKVFGTDFLVESIENNPEGSDESPGGGPSRSLVTAKVTAVVFALMEFVEEGYESKQMIAPWRRTEVPVIDLETGEEVVDPPPLF